MDHRCLRCNDRCVPKYVCMNCLDGARSELFKLELDTGVHLNIDESEFYSREMITNNNPSRAMIYYHVAKVGEHTVIIIPHNGFDVDNVWLDDQTSQPSKRNLSDDLV